MLPHQQLLDFSQCLDAGRPLGICKHYLDSTFVAQSIYDLFGLLHKELFAAELQRRELAEGERAVGHGERAARHLNFKFSLALFLN